MALTKLYPALIFIRLFHLFIFGCKDLYTTRHKKELGLRNINVSFRRALSKGAIAASIDLNAKNR